MSELLNNALAPTVLPSVPVLGHLVLSWPTQDPAKPWLETHATISVPIDQALTSAFDSDAHFVAYESDRRLNTQAIGACSVKMVVCVVDVDVPNHARPTPEWRAVEREKVGRLHAKAPGCCAYETRGGYRLVWRLSKPLELDNATDAALWSQMYRGWLAWLERETGIVGDPACADWTRLYRLPFVNRDGVDQRLPAGGDLRAGTWDFMRGHEYMQQPANTNAVRVTVTDEDAGDPALVDPLIDCIIVELRSAGLWEDGRQKYFLSFCGFLLGKGWAQSELERLVERMSSKADEYLRMVRRARPMDGPGQIKNLLPAEAFARLDAAANAHPNAVARVEAQHAQHAGLRESMARSLPTPAPQVYAVPPMSVVNANAAASANALAEKERRTDLGNARRLVRLNGTDLRYCPARDLWYAWDGSRWAPDDTGEIIRRAKATAETLWDEARDEADDEKRKASFAWAAKCQDRARLSNMVELAKSEPGIPVRVTELDADPWMLSVQNGVLDLRTGQLHPPTREMLITKRCSAHFDPSANSELWQAFVTRTTGGDVELARYLQRALGYALYGAWREKAFWFAYGPPDGAKSTMLGVIGSVLGDYHFSAAASTWMVQSNAGGNRGDVTRLLGARFVTSFEIRSGLRFDEELVKKVTGGDTIVAAAKYESEIEFAPSFSLWMAANDRPAIRDDDEGMWSRMRCVPFTNPVPPTEIDPQLKEKLTSPAHAPAVLTWLVNGCIEWQRHGIGTCAAVTTATKAYRANMNRAAAFFDARCVLTGNSEDTVPSKVMRQAYDAWCAASNVRAPLAASAFGQRLRALGVVGGDDASRVNGQRCWSGVRLRTGEES